MADEIKIKVGVQSDVKAGMQQTVKDLERSMQGRGFMEVFGKALRGDVSGALEDLAERMKVGMNTIMGKAITWGGGIATALFAGFKAGQQLDEMLGISQKIADAWAGPINSKIDATTKAMRNARLEAMREAEAAKKESDFQKERGGIIAERGAIGGTAQDRLNLETKKMLDLQASIYEEGISIEEQRKRVLEYEKQINATKQAALAADKEAEDLRKKEEDDKRKLAEDEARWNEEVAAADIEAGQDAFRKELERAADKQQADKEAIENQIKGEQEQYDARRAALQELINLGKEAAGAGDLAMRPDDWRAQQKSNNQAKRENERQAAAVAQAEAMQARGIKLPPRLQALIDAAKAEAAGKDAAKKQEALDKEWKEKQKQAADAILRLEGKLDGIAKG